VELFAVSGPTGGDVGVPTASFFVGRIPKGYRDAGPTRGVYVELQALAVEIELVTLTALRYTTLL
jgi:hypothetical protein